MDSTAKVFDSTTADNASRGFRPEGSSRHGGVKQREARCVLEHVRTGRTPSQGAVRRPKLAGELAPQQLPNGGLRQRLPKLHALQDLVRGEVSPPAVADVLLGH